MFTYIANNIHIQDRFFATPSANRLVDTLHPALVMCCNNTKNNAPRQIPNAIRKSWNPFFFNTINKNTKESREIIYSRFEKLIFLLSLPCVSIILFSEDIILIFGNSNYHAASYIIPIYAFTYFISTIDFLSSNQITASEKLMNQLPSALIGVYVLLS